MLDRLRAPRLSQGMARELGQKKHLMGVECVLEQVLIIGRAAAKMGSRRPYLPCRMTWLASVVAPDPTVPAKLLSALG